MKTAKMTNRLGSIVTVMLVVAACTASVLAVPFTPGNLVICTAPSPPGGSPPGTCPSGNAAPVQITLREYTTAGALVQTIPLPTSGALYGLTDGAATTAPQIKFSAINNQRIYISTSYTNSGVAGSGCAANNESPGYMLYDASTNTVVEAVSNVFAPTAGFDGRGVDTLNGCTVFDSTSNNNAGTYRTVNGISQQFIAGNARYLNIFDPWPGFPTPFPGVTFTPAGSALAFISSSGTTQGFTGPAMYVFDPLGAGCPTPCTTSEVQLFSATGSNPQGFFVADANTIYMGESWNPFTGDPASTGLYKFSWQACGGTAWVNVGRLNSIAGETPSGQVMDVVGTVSGGNATLYVVGGGETIGATKIYKVGPDPLVNACPTSTWKTTTTTTLVSGLVGARSIDIVPNTIVPPNRTLTTGVASGSGTVSPATNSYPQCTVVNPTATPAVNNAFLNWTDASNVNLGSRNDPGTPSNSLRVQMDSNKTVNANFTSTTANWVLTINISGRGSVKANPPNITYTYPVVDVQNIAYAKPGPTVVTLTATPTAANNQFPPANGFVFDHWTGPVANPNAATTTVSVGADTTVTAVFLPIYRVRTFATGNGRSAITSPATNDAADHDNTGSPTFPYYRQGTVLTLQGTASTFCVNPAVPPADTWTFSEWQDANAVQVPGGTANPFVTPAVVAPVDYTAAFTEASANPARALTPGNLVVAQVRDFSSFPFPGEIDLREYTPSGQLVQPVIRIPTSGTPSGQNDSATSAVGLQIALDNTIGNKVLTAVNKVNAGLNTGFIRSMFNGTAWTQDLSTGTFAFGAEGRGVAVIYPHVYYALDGGLHDYNVSTATDSLVASDCNFSDNCRLVRVFNGKLYVGTAASGVVGSDDFNGLPPNTGGGPGIYRVDFPGGSPANPTSCSPPNSGTNANFIQILPTPGATPLDFAFASSATGPHPNAITLYVGFNSGGSPPPSYANIHKFTTDDFTAGTPPGSAISWNDASFGQPAGISTMGVQWVSAIDLTVDANNDDCHVYLMATGDPSPPCESPATFSPGPVNAYVYRIDDKLLTAGHDWFTLDPTSAYNATTNPIAIVVPMVSRGRGLQIVRTPYCATKLGDTNGDNVINGKDIQSYIACYIAAGVSGTPTTSPACGCADVQLSHVLNQANVNAFVTLLLSQ